MNESPFWFEYIKIIIKAKLLYLFSDKQVLILS